MADLADYKRKVNSRKYVQDFPLGILDVIEVDYPIRYPLMFDNQTPMITSMTSLFTPEEWMDILTKSRNSYNSHIRHADLWRKDG